MDCSYSKESVSLSHMSGFSSNGPVSISCYDNSNENCPRMEQAALLFSIDSAMPFFQSCQEQFPENCVPLHQLQSDRGRFSLKNDWDLYQNTMGCPSYPQMPMPNLANLSIMDTLSPTQRQLVEHLQVAQQAEVDLVIGLSQRHGNDSSGATGPGMCVSASNASQCLPSEMHHGTWNLMNPPMSRVPRLPADQNASDAHIGDDCSAQYPFQPELAERATRLSSANFSCFSSSAMGTEQRNSDTSYGCLSSEEVMPIESARAPISLPRILMPGTADPVPDPIPRESLCFAAGCDHFNAHLLKYPKHELEENCTSGGGYPNHEDVKPSSLDLITICSDLAQTDLRLVEQPEQPKEAVLDFSEGHTSLSSSKDCCQLSKRRSENQDKLDIKSDPAGASPKEPDIKNADQKMVGDSAKRQKCQKSCKVKEESKTGGGKEKIYHSQGDRRPNSGKDKSSKLAEAPKQDFIHVRARRGQATDSHSLAERVRREKISERMKFLQDLVPGCSKITGKALMLDEIINYVQFLQHQVVCLSMKLAALSPRIDFNCDDLFLGEVLLPSGSHLDVGTVSDMATSSGAPSHKMPQTTFLSSRDPCGNFARHPGNIIASEPSFDSTRSYQANLASATNTSSQTSVWPGHVETMGLIEQAMYSPKLEPKQHDISL
eukprot:c29173_g1_i5 orf=1175-3154(+)